MMTTYFYIYSLVVKSDNAVLQNQIRDKKIKLDLFYTRGITPKRVASGGIKHVHLRELASGRHSSEETSQR